MLEWPEPLMEEGGLYWCGWPLLALELMKGGPSQRERREDKTKEAE